MILSIENIKKIKEDSNLLTGAVCDYIISEWDNYENKKDIFLNVLNNGCANGAVKGLVYYSDTVKFYESYKFDINKLLCKVLNDCGLNSPAELFGDKWDETDLLAVWENNQNLLAWFGFEETITNIAYKFGIE